MYEKRHYGKSLQVFRAPHSHDFDCISAWPPVNSGDFAALFLATGNTALSQTAFYMVAAGIVGGVVAAPFGWWDWFFIPAKTRAKSVGLLHGVGNVIMLLLFTLSWLLWRPQPTQPGTFSLLLAFIAFALAGITGWLGGELVDRLGIGVDKGANPNAPSSLSKRPAQP